MAREKENRLVDPDVHLMIKDYYKRLRGGIENLSRLTYRKETINGMILNFVTHLKRKDRDVGGLPWYSKQYTSTKTNKEHALLCLISMLVQVFWDIRDGTFAVNSDSVGDELDEFEVNLAKLEGVAKLGMDAYRIHGKMPDYELMTQAMIIELEAQEELTETEELKAEREECNRIEDAAEAKELMDAELGESGDSENTQEYDDHDHAQDAAQEAAADDQLSVEDADRCAGDCDNCTDKVCDPDELADEHHAEVDAGLVGDDICEGGYTEPADNEAGGANDSEQYPDAEPLEQTIKDTQAKLEEPAKEPGNNPNHRIGSPPIPKED